jgi:hypothetical protein
LLCQLPSVAKIVELGLPSTLDPPTFFCCTEFSGIVQLAVTVTVTDMLTGIVTEAGIVNLGALYSKKIMVVSANVFHQPCPTVLSNPGLLTTKRLLPETRAEAVG